MSWVMVGIAGGSAALGLMQGKAKQKAEQENMRANAEAIRMSPWTGMNPGMMRAGGESPLLGAAQGALGGAMMGQQFKGSMAPSAAGAPMSQSSDLAMLDPRLKKNPGLMGGGSGPTMIG